MLHGIIMYFDTLHSEKGLLYDIVIYLSILAYLNKFILILG